MVTQVFNEMVHIDEFANEMAWVSEDFRNDQIEMIWHNIDNGTYRTMERLGSDYDNENCHIIFDVNLSSIISNLTYNGYDADKICNMISANYGQVMNIYYMTDDDMYCIVIGWE